MTTIFLSFLAVVAAFFVFGSLKTIRQSYVGMVERLGDILPQLKLWVSQVRRPKRI